MPRMTIVARFVLLSVILSLFGVPAQAGGIFTDGSGYAYAPYLATPPSQFGSMSFSFNNAGASGPNGAGVFWNYGGSVVMWLANLGDLSGNGGVWVRPTLQLQSPAGDTQFITAGPPIYSDGNPHIVSVAYGMEQYGSAVAAFMHWNTDGVYTPWGDSRNTVIAMPAYAFAPDHDNGWGWFSAWPSDGNSIFGGVNYHPGDFSAFGGGANPNGAAVWLHGTSDLWYNQLGADIAFYNEGFVDVFDMVTWP